MEEYYSSLEACGNRYKVLAEQSYMFTPVPSNEIKALVEFVDEFLQGCADRLPLMKLNRWLGYIQGTLIAWNMTTVQTERDWTRPLFRPLDFTTENL